MRSRKIFPVEFLITLILGDYSKEEPSISNFHRIYNSLVDKEKQVVYSSFYDRFSNEALTFIDKCLETLMNRKAVHEGFSVMTPVCSDLNFSEQKLYASIIP